MTQNRLLSNVDLYIRIASLQTHWHFSSDCELTGILRYPTSPKIYIMGTVAYVRLGSYFGNGLGRTHKNRIIHSHFYKHIEMRKRTKGYGTK